MDPEDLLEIKVPPLPSSPKHEEMNTQVLNMLVDLNTTYRYTWLDMTERYGVESGMEVGAKLWNEAMARAQKARLKPVVLSDDGPASFSSEE
jgi:hypothetical protein